MAAAQASVIWHQSPPSDFETFVLWARRCNSVTVTPNRVQTKVFKRPTYSVCFFRAMDSAASAAARAAPHAHGVEPRSSHPSFVHFGPMCQAAAKVRALVCDSPWR